MIANNIWLKCCTISNWIACVKVIGLKLYSSVRLLILSLLHLPKAPGEIQGTKCAFFLLVVETPAYYLPIFLSLSGWYGWYICSMQHSRLADLRSFETLKLMEVETSLGDHVAARAWQVVGKRSNGTHHSRVMFQSLMVRLSLNRKYPRRLTSRRGGGSKGRWWWW